MPKPKDISLKKMQRNLWLLGVVKIPLIWYVRPKLLQLDDKIVKAKIKLRRRTKNHLNSMYFGALAVGADVAAGIFAFYFSEKSGRKVSFAFKSMEAQFLKRGESDIFFVSDQGELVQKAFDESAKTGERVNQKIEVKALDTSNEEVALFVMEVSVKVK